MRRLPADRTTLVWLFLVVATLFSWRLGTDRGVSDAAVASSLILVIAFVKLRLVGRYFMELRHAPVALVTIFEVWVLVVGTAMITMFLTGS